MSKYMKRLGFLMVLGACSLYGQWEADVRITDSIWTDYGSYNNGWTIAAKDSFVHIVWERRTPTGIGQLHHIRSTDSGATFEPAQRLILQDAHYSSIAIWDNIVHVIWDERYDGGADSNDIHYMRSTDYGVTWEPQVRISHNTINTNVKHPSLAVHDNVVHVVWDDDRTGSREIYYRRSTDYGVNWEPEIRFTYANYGVRFPSVAVWDNIVHVVWGDARDDDWGEIYYKRSTDYGANWEPEVRLTYTNDNEDTWEPAIAVWDNIIHVVWRDRRNASLSEVYYKRSTNYGVNWESDVRLTYDCVGALGHRPSIAVYDSAVHIVWGSYTEYEIYYKGSDNDGVSWGGNVRLTYAADISYFPSVAATPCDYDVHIAWKDRRDGNDEIYYKRHHCGPTYVEEKLQVTDYKLQVFPNPATTKTGIQFTVNGLQFTDKRLATLNSQLLTLKIYDLSGRLVKSFVISPLSSGRQPTTVVWEGKEVKSGIYFYRVNYGDYEDRGKFVILY